MSGLLDGKHNCPTHIAENRCLRTYINEDEINLFVFFGRGEMYRIPHSPRSSGRLEVMARGYFGGQQSMKIRRIVFHM